MKKFGRIIALTVLFTLIFSSYSFIQWRKSESAFVKGDLSKFNSNAAVHLQGKTQMELLRNLLYFAGSEGDFGGRITQERQWNGDLVITILDLYVPDDSVGPQEQRFVATKKENGYVVTEYYVRSSCHRYPNLWQELLYMFVNPLWTTSNCS